MSADYLGSGGAPLGVLPAKDERTWALAAHLASFAGYVVPFGNVVGPLVVWLIKKDEMPFVDDQGKEAVNFQISVTIYVLACIVLFFLILPILLAVAIGVADVILTVVAAVKANDGVAYRYPFNLRLIQ